MSKKIRNFIVGLTAVATLPGLVGCYNQNSNAPNGEKTSVTTERSNGKSSSERTSQVNSYLEEMMSEEVLRCLTSLELPFRREIIGERSVTEFFDFINKKYNTDTDERFKYYDHPEGRLQRREGRSEGIYYISFFNTDFKKQFEERGCSFLGVTLFVNGIDGGKIVSEETYREALNVDNFYYSAVIGVKISDENRGFKFIDTDRDGIFDKYEEVSIEAFL